MAAGVGDIILQAAQGIVAMNQRQQQLEITRKQVAAQAEQSDRNHQLEVQRLQEEKKLEKVKTAQAQARLETNQLQAQAQVSQAATSAGRLDLSKEQFAAEQAAGPAAKTLSETQLKARSGNVDAVRLGARRVVFDEAKTRVDPTSPVFEAKGKDKDQLIEAATWPALIADVHDSEDLSEQVGIVDRDLARLSQQPFNTPKNEQSTARAQERRVFLTEYRSEMEKAGGFRDTTPAEVRSHGANIGASATNIEIAVAPAQQRSRLKGLYGQGETVRTFQAKASIAHQAKDYRSFMHAAWGETRPREQDLNALKDAIIDALGGKDDEVIPIVRQNFLEIYGTR